MGSTKGAGALIAALVPIAYCGAMVYYFLGVGGSVRGVAAIGLGPTVLGLGGIGLLFCIPLLLRILKLVGPSTPKPGARARVPADAPEEDAFDADAALARDYPGERAGRQPVHTLYVPADQVTPDLVDVWRSSALGALHGQDSKP